MTDSKALKIKDMNERIALRKSRGKADKLVAAEFRDEMRNEVLNGKEWMGYRKITVNDRKVLGDTISETLVAFATKQGREPGKAPNGLFINYHKMINSALVTIDPRLDGIINCAGKALPEWLTNMQLLHLAAVMKITTNMILKLVKTDIKYNDIRLEAKVEVEAYAERIGGKTRVMSAYLDEYLIPALDARVIEDRLALETKAKARLELVESEGDL